MAFPRLGEALGRGQLDIELPSEDHLSLCRVGAVPRTQVANAVALPQKARVPDARMSGSCTVGLIATIALHSATFMYVHRRRVVYLYRRGGIVQRSLSHFGGPSGVPPSRCGARGVSW